MNLILERRNLFIIVFVVLFVYLLNFNNLSLRADDSVDGKHSFEFPGKVQWVNTGLKISADKYVRFKAEGEVEISEWKFLGRNDYSYIVGPEGTYNYSDKVALSDFPLPSGDAGPTPCYSLIGKFDDDGAPFFIGKKNGFIAPSNSILFLGINDFDVSDNKGSFNVEVEVSSQKPEDFDLIDKRQIVASPIAENIDEKIEKPKVLLIYIDGLNYDVLKEMAYAGYLPNIKSYFFDSGSDYINSFTTFPSSTFQSAGSTLTGMFLDKTGVKQEMFFDREKLTLDHFFKPFGPNTAARTIRPDFFGKVNYKRDDNLKLIYDYTAENELNFASTILPVQHTSPPKHVMKTIANSGYFSAHKVHYNLDKINAAYAMENVIKRKNDLMYVWLPGPDVSGHISARGQWGLGRKKLYLIDGMIGKIMDKLKKLGIFDQTYKILYADHGHVGGKYYINQSYDISNELFFKSIVMKNGKLSDEGGFGFNVKFAEEDRLLENFHSDTDKKHYMASAVEGFGMVNVYLPYKSKYSGNMSKRNDLYTLTNYTVTSEEDSVDLLEMTLAVDKSAENKYPDLVSGKPVDLILLKLSESQVLIIKNNMSQAIIERKKVEGSQRSFVYKYSVISSIRQSEDGQISFNENPAINIDPLDYLSDINIANTLSNEPNWLNNFHTADEWLKISASSRYPDAVVQFSHFFLWDDAIKNLEKKYIPDFVVTANRGWNFRSDGVKSTDHGYPFAESMKIPFFIAGPTIKRGVMLTQPRRITDILPTTLDLLNISYDETVLDGRSLLVLNKVKAAELDTNKVKATELNRNKITTAELDTNRVKATKLNRYKFKNRYKVKTAELNKDKVKTGELSKDKVTVTVTGLNNAQSYEYGLKGSVERYISFPQSYALPKSDYKESEKKHQSVSLHDYDSPVDLHNIAADVKFTLDLSLFKLSDDLLDLVIPGDKKNLINSTLDLGLDTIDKIPDNIGKRRFFELLDALRIRSLSIADLSMLSGDYANDGNLHRANSIIDWSQNVMGDFNKLLGAPFFRLEKGLIPGKHMNKYLIDYPQAGIDALLKGLVEVAGRSIFASIFGIEHGVGKILSIFNSDDDKKTPEIKSYEINNTPPDDKEEFEQEEVPEFEMITPDFQAKFIVPKKYTKELI